MQVIESAKLVGEIPNYQDNLANDPGTNPGFDISGNHFRNRRIELVRWALRNCNRLVDADRLVKLAQNEGIFSQVRPELMRTNKRIYTVYKRRRFTNGVITVPANGGKVIRVCEQNNWTVVGGDDG